MWCLIALLCRECNFKCKRDQYWKGMKGCSYISSREVRLLHNSDVLPSHPQLQQRR
jgi:hypothetical protein